MSEERAEYIRALIAARIPELSADQIIEALSPGDLDDDSGIPPHIASQVLDVIAMLAGQDGFNRGPSSPRPGWSSAKCALPRLGISTHATCRG